MRSYVPMSKSELESFVLSSSLVLDTIYLPTLALAEDYGVSDEEEVEYAALEIARAAAESKNKPFVVAFESVKISQKEIAPGVVVGEFPMQFGEVVAIYLIEDPNEELEWYDPSESAICLAKAER